MKPFFRPFFRAPSRPRSAAAIAVALGLGLSMDLRAEAAPAAPEAKAPAAGAPFAGRLASPPILSGKFTQEKNIVGLKRPLLSQGDFLVARDRGVIWRTAKPFAAAVAVTRKGIWSLKPSGTGLQRESIHQGNLGVAMDMIQQVLAGDPASLDKAFAVSGQGDAKAWTLDLKPLDPVVARVILSIRLQGGRHVDHVEYAEANGDKTRIDFSGVADDAGDLASWQATAFRD